MLMIAWLQLGMRKPIWHTYLAVSTLGIQRAVKWCKNDGAWERLKARLRRVMWHIVTWREILRRVSLAIVLKEGRRRV